MKLLVSVRSVAEARSALAGGAHFIDVKEPAAGALGMADPTTIAAIVAEVAGRVPVSAALGELDALTGTRRGALPPELRFVKCGLAGWRARPWREELATHGPGMVAVAYIDADRVAAPPLAEVIAWAVTHPAAALLIDTAVKDGSTLLDYFAVPSIKRMVMTARSAQVPVAVAGSLSATEIRRMRRVPADWFAVRGAVCGGGRLGYVDAERVRALIAHLPTEFVQE
jgi:hypothetical protein